MKVFTVTSASDDPASGLTLREAVERAEGERGGATIVFAEGINLVTLTSDIDIARGTITIDGDFNGDGILDVFIGTATNANTHHFTIRKDATVVLKDVGLYNGKSYDASNGDDGESGASFQPPAPDGADGEQIGVAAGAGTAAIAAAAAGLADAELDGAAGGTGLDGQDGAAGGRGGDAAGSIVNSGNLTLVRTGLFLNGAVAGDGGRGGNGGVGQAGGEGGDGAVGGVKVGTGTGVGAVYVGTEGAVDSGPGGNGGDGGDGGAGGAGGRGGDAAGAILNRATGTITMVDVALGGRIAHGLLADQFENSAYGGNGGQGGNGGNGAAGGAGGYGAQDVNTVAPEDAAYTGDIFDLRYNDGVGSTYDYIWSGIIETRIPGQSLSSRVYEEDAQGDGRFMASTEAGRGGRGGDGGDGGAAGFNGAGGHAATIVNYGTITGTAAFGTTNFADGGEGDPSDFFDPVGIAGNGASGARGGGGGGETDGYFWTQRPISYVLGEYESWASGDPELIGELGTSGSGYAYAVGLPPIYDAPDPAPDGRDGTNGADGAAGGLSPDGRESDRIVSEGTAAGFDRDDGMVYLTGVRQDPAFNQLLFSVVRVGDTAQAVTVTYEVFGVGKNGVRDNDFSDPALLSGTIDFASINQQAATFDSTGAGVAHLSLGLSLGSTGEGAEQFRIVLRSDDVMLGTSIYTGSLFDGAYTRITGSRGNDRQLDGTNDADVIEALEGDDRVDGRNGDDFIFGSAGRDTITGGRGNDALFGGADADVFVFAGASGRDRIGDFLRGDRIDLTDYGIAFDDLALADTRRGAEVTHAGGIIVLEGLGADDIRQADFIFA